jgi:glycosyltransferase involved in cell wall biosynthesis
VKYFVENVMPLLRQRLPGIRFHVYGSDPPEELAALASEDVIIEGYIENISDVYDRCRVFVAPLLAGAGLKGKVIESLAHGTPTVLSPLAAEGTGLRHGQETLIAESPREWAEMIAALYQDPALWQSISRRSQDFARITYSFERGRGLMAKALEAAGVARACDPCQPRALVSRTTRCRISGASGVTSRDVAS